MSKSLNYKQKHIKSLDAHHSSVHRQSDATIVRPKPMRIGNSRTHDWLMPGAEILARILDVPLRTAQRWVQLGRIPKPYERLRALLERGELPKGWRIRCGALVSDLGHEIAFEQIRALPYLVQALAAHQAEVRKLRAQVASMATVTRIEHGADSPMLNGVTIDARLADLSSDAAPTAQRVYPAARTVLDE